MSGLWKGILIASLAVNFLFAGFVVGHQIGKGKSAPEAHMPGQAMRGQGMHHRAMLENPMMLVRMMVAAPILDDEARLIIRKTYKEHLPDIRRRAKAIEKARLEALSVLMAVPFDRAAYDKATEKLQNLEAEQAEQVWAGMADALMALPKERREGLQTYLRVKAEDEYTRRKAIQQKRQQKRGERLQTSDEADGKPGRNEK